VFCQNIYDWLCYNLIIKKYDMKISCRKACVLEYQSFSKKCRDSVYCEDTKKFLLSRIAGSEQERDLSVPPNCLGYGRIRHFRRFISDDWGNDPLPIEPAQKALKLSPSDSIESQVFQIASCNVSCWYCFVPDSMKRADENTSKWFSASEMIDLFMEENSNIRMIDLSGGNPELVPEWILETMKALTAKKLQDKIYLWSDDTLTTDYTFKYLCKQDLNYMKNYRNYGKVCCFKGFDNNSFTFNTHLSTDYFDKQFDYFSQYLELGIDLYGYVTFTTDNLNEINEKISVFIRRLKEIHPLLPLRIVPLKISKFSVLDTRINNQYLNAIKNQIKVYTEWNKQLQNSYTQEQLSAKICDIPLL